MALKQIVPFAQGVLLVFLVDASVKSVILVDFGGTFWRGVQVRVD